MITTTRQQRRAMAKAAEKFPMHLVEIPREQWPSRVPPGLIEVWRSRQFLVQVFVEKGCRERLTVNRTVLIGGKWAEEITWEDLMRCKRECGRGNQWAVECFPPDDQVVNVANMRHLWVLLEWPAYGWHNQRISL